MTNLEAIKSVVAGYPLSENTFNLVLLDRGLSAASEYTGKSKEFELATADLYKVLVTAVNISEGDYQIGMTDKSNFIKLANAVYLKYDEPLITDTAKKTIEVPRGKSTPTW